MDFYKSALKRPLSSAYVYIIILTLLISSIVGITLGFQARRDFQGLSRSISDGTIPTFELAHGRLIVDTNEPIIIDDGLSIIIIDMTNTYSVNDLFGYQVGYLITPERVIIKMNQQDPQAFSFAQYEGLTLNNQSLANILDAFTFFILLIVLLINLIASMFVLFFSSFLASLLINIFRVFGLVPFKFGQTYKLVLFSYGFPMLWNQVRMLIPIAFPLVLHYIIMYGFSFYIIVRLSLTLLKEATKS